MTPERETLDQALGILWLYAQDAPDAQDAAGLEYVSAARRAVVEGLDALTAANARAEAAEGWAALWKRAAKAARGDWHDAMRYWQASAEAYGAMKKRAEALERERDALRWERNELAAANRRAEQAEQRAAAAEWLSKRMAGLLETTMPQLHAAKSHNTGAPMPIAECTWGLCHLHRELIGKAKALAAAADAGQEGGAV